MMLDIRDARASDETEWRRLWSGYLTFYKVDLAPEVTASTWRRIMDPASPVGMRVAERGGKLDLDAVLKTLNAEGITRLMVEGGPTVAASFVGAGLVDEVALLRGPKDIGEGGIAPLEGMKLSALTDGLTALGSEQLGADTLELYGRA